jgi:Helicase associated domain
VIAEITKVKGRFLKEESDGSWTEVDHARAIEKTCQALRQREKANPPLVDPFSTSNIKLDLLIHRVNSKRPRRDSVSNRSSDDENTSSNDSESHSAGDGSVARKSFTTESTDVSEEVQSYTNASTRSESPQSAEDASRTMSDAAKLNSTRMMEKLQRFRLHYGHCGVPPKWPKDVALADWCSQQRQMRRESGYRDISPEEEERIWELDELGFSWDYSQWHWNDRYQKLKELVVQTTQNDADDNVEEEVLLKALPPEAHHVFQWLQDQRCQLRTGSTVLTEEQVDKLGDIGIVL